MLRHTRQRTANPAARAPRLLALLAALALTAAACGGDDEPIEIEGATSGEGTDAADDGTTSEPGADEEADAAADEAADDATDASEGPYDPDDGEHRLEAAARSAIDCDAVATTSPGAVIVFPDSNDPASLQVGAGPVTVEVVGCSDTFEANIQYDAFHGQNSTPTLSGFTEGGTLGDWGEFSFEETYWTPGDWTVVVFVNDAESGNRVEYDQVTFTVD